MVVDLDVQPAINLLWWMRIDQCQNVVVKKRKKKEEEDKEDKIILVCGQI